MTVIKIILTAINNLTSCTNSPSTALPSSNVSSRYTPIEVSTASAVLSKMIRRIKSSMRVFDFTRVNCEVIEYMFFDNLSKPYKQKALPQKL